MPRLENRMAADHWVHLVQPPPGWAEPADAVCKDAGHGHLADRIAQLEADLAAAQAARKERTDLLITAAHDLLQPVNAARLWLSVLHAHEVNEPTRTILAQVERALGTADDFLGALLSTARIEAGVMKPQIGPTPLPPILSAICASFEVQARAKGLRCRIRYSDEVVLADGVMLQRILQNLVSNAVRYTASGGVLVATRRRGDFCAIEVYDTGPGIREDERDAIFDEFRRGGSRTAVNDLAMGLGLSVARRLAAAIGAHIEVRSRPGRGSCFRLLVPRAGAPEAAAPRQSYRLRSSALSAALVVAVDPDPEGRARLMRLISGWSALGIAVPDFAEFRALSRHLERAPDLILADARAASQPGARAAIDALRASFRRAIPLLMLAEPDGRGPAMMADEDSHLLPRSAGGDALETLAAHLVGRRCERP